MVILHFKITDKNQFLYEVKTGMEITDIIREGVAGTLI